MDNNDFNRLHIPVHTVEKGQDIVNKFKELQEHIEFSMYPHSDRNDVIRYVVYAYDPESPFVKNSTSELSKRKEAAADAAGFERNKRTGLFAANVTELMELRNEEVNRMVICYLKMLHNYTWTQIVTYEQLFWEYISLLLEPLVNTDEKKLMEAANIKGKLREECNKIKQDLDKFKKEFYGDNADLKEKVERVRPETIHKQVFKVS